MPIASVERFWCPREAGYALDDDGFLRDPDTAWFLGSGALRTDALTTHRCLALLGEPGTGKSTAVANRMVAEEVQVAFFDLAAYGSEDRLVREIFESPTVLTWSAATGELCLVLDSLDEARARIPHIGAVIADRIRRLPCDRLFLRIACRTADWPAALEESLNEEFGTVAVMEILPLRRVDVVAIAAAWCDPERFVDEAVQAGAGPLAARPLTLRFLARAFGESGSLPERGAALYAAGIRSLCEEQNTTRRDAWIDSGLSVDERIAVARRMAAATVFGGVRTLWTGPEIDASMEDIALERLTALVEPVPGGEPIMITIRAVREAARTGLFTSRGGQRLGWAHATFADFLAADWIVTNDLSARQAEPLLLGPDGRCWPQTRLAAAWAVAIAPERFGFLTAADPAAFQGEVELPGDTLRAAVIDGLFSVASTLTAAPWERSYQTLRHSEVAAQLRAHLRDPDPDRRRLALDLAADCAAVELHDDLIAIAVDATAMTHDRVAAGRALTRLPDPYRTAGLRPLVLGPALRNDDETDDLKGVALLASWPQALSSAEVFSVLTPRKRRNYYGSYAIFIGHFREGITEADIDVGLQWLLEDLDGPASDHITAGLANRVLELAASRSTEMSVVDAFIRVALARLQDYGGLLYEDFRDGQRADPLADPAFRRTVAAEILASIPPRGALHRLSGHSSHSLGIVRAEDLEWLADGYAAADGELRIALLSLFRWTFDFRLSEHRNLALNMAHDHPLYAEFVHTWVDPVALNSPEAEQLRQSWEMNHEPPPAKEEGGDDINGQIEELLVRFDNGEAIGFWYTTRLLTIAPGSKHFGAEFDPDIASMGRWPTLTEYLQGRIVDAAERYLLSQQCWPQQWLEKPEILHQPAQAGYKAMVLLLRLAPERLRRLPGGAWVEWAPVLASWPTSLANGARWDDKVQLLDLAGPDARDAARSALLTRVRATVAIGRRSFAENEAGYLWNADVAATYLVLARTAASEPREELVAVLSEHDLGLLRPLLLEWLEDSSDVDRQRLAARQLIEVDLDRSWPMIKAVFNADLGLAERALGSSRIVHGDGGIRHATAPVLADIYLWLRAMFPPESDPQFDEAHAVGPREQIGHWRDRLLSRLRDQGTPASVAAVRAIAAALPNDRWLGRTLATAEAALRRNQWSPTPLPQLLQLAADRRATLVHDAAALATAVAGALETVKTRLTGATPESHYLWDTHAGRPKSEDEISDYLANELDRVLAARGAIINREVQIRRNRPSGIGERTDLLVDAAPVGGPNTGRLSLPVEVKGVWNDELLTAMRDQLVHRYMRDVASSDGIYVVVWPDLQSWTDATDSRRAVLASLDREPIEAQLAEQAADLALRGVSVHVVHLDISYGRPQ